MLIDDSEFIRADRIPMTKKNIRLLVLALADIEKDSIVYDIGGGTGALSIDAARLCPEGFVHTLEKNSASIDLIRKNMEKFRVENLKLIESEAPEGMEDLTPADVILVGGSGGKIEQILARSVDQLKSHGKIIVTAITLQTISKAIDFFHEHEEFRCESIQAQINRIARIKNLDMLFAENPIFILKAWR